MMPTLRCLPTPSQRLILAFNVGIGAPLEGLSVGMISGRNEHTSNLTIWRLAGRLAAFLEISRNFRFPIYSDSPPAVKSWVKSSRWPQNKVNLQDIQEGALF